MFTLTANCEFPGECIRGDELVHVETIDATPDDLPQLLVELLFSGITGWTLKADNGDTVAHFGELATEPAKMAMPTSVPFTPSWINYAN